MVSNTTRGFLVGLLGGALALGVSYLLRVFAGGVFLPELAVPDAVLVDPWFHRARVRRQPAEPGQVFRFHDRHRRQSSPLRCPRRVTLPVQEYLSAVGKARAAALVHPSPLRILAAIGIILLFTTAVLSSPVSAPVLLVTLLPPQIVFGLVLGQFHVAVPVKPTETLRPNEGAQGKEIRQEEEALHPGWSRLRSRRRDTRLRRRVPAPSAPPPRLPANPASLIPEYYGQRNFYRVDVNIFPPSVNGSTWSSRSPAWLTIPLKLSLDQLQQMAYYDQYNTLECVSNTIGGDLISTAQWRGVRLKDVLNMAGLQSSAEYIVFTAVDGYDTAIPLDRAMLDGTLLAFEMNGEPLPTAHGYPLRAIVPGLYGMMNCKVDHQHTGGKRGLPGILGAVGAGPMTPKYNTGSSIVIPGDAQVTDRFGIDGSSDVALGMVPIAGIAFAGDRGNPKVEVSTDDGNTWTTASLTPALGLHLGLLVGAVEPSLDGSYKLMVRATDGTGAVQTAVVAAPFPDGATGYQVVDISVLPASLPLPRPATLRRLHRACNRLHHLHLLGRYRTSC